MRGKFNDVHAIFFFFFQIFFLIAHVVGIPFELPRLVDPFIQK